MLEPGLKLLTLAMSLYVLSWLFHKLDFGNFGVWSKQKYFKKIKNFLETLFFSFGNLIPKCPLFGQRFPKRFKNPGGFQQQTKKPRLIWGVTPSHPLGFPGFSFGLLPMSSSSLTSCLLTTDYMRCIRIWTHTPLAGVHYCQARTV